MVINSEGKGGFSLSWNDRVIAAISRILSDLRERVKKLKESALTPDPIPDPKVTSDAKHKANDIIDDGYSITIICNCGFEAEGLDYWAAGLIMDEHIDANVI
jgi:hypothetical protein